MNIVLLPLQGTITAHLQRVMLIMLLVATNNEIVNDSGASCHVVQVCWVPGSFEIPVVAKAMAKSGKFDAVIGIGVVVSHGSIGVYSSHIGWTKLQDCSALMWAYFTHHEHFATMLTLLLGDLHTYNS